MVSPSISYPFLDCKAVRSSSVTHWNMTSVQVVEVYDVSVCRFIARESLEFFRLYRLGYAEADPGSVAAPLGLSDKLGLHFAGQLVEYQMPFFRLRAINHTRTRGCALGLVPPPLIESDGVILWACQL